MATFPLIDSALLMTKTTVKPIVKPTIRPKASIKQKCSWLANSTSKHTKKNLAFDFYLIFDLVSIAGKSSTSVMWPIPNSLIFF